MLKFNLPTAVTLALGILAGVLEYLADAAFSLQSPWYAAVKYGILLIGLVGVTPLVGANLGTAIRNVLHMTPASFTALGAGVYALAAFVQTFNISGDARAIILGVIAFAATIGIGVAPAGHSAVSRAHAS